MFQHVLTLGPINLFSMCCEDYTIGAFVIHSNSYLIKCISIWAIDNVINLS